MAVWAVQSVQGKEAQKLPLVAAGPVKVPGGGGFLAAQPLSKRPPHHPGALDGAPLLKQVRFVLKFVLEQAGW